MQKQMKLRGTVSRQDSRLIFTSQLHEGSPLSLQVFEHDIEMSEEMTAEKTTVDGHLFVTLEAQQDSRCYLTLPQASLVFGKQVVVNENWLMPRGATLKDFGPRKKLTQD